jgi:hypothetical protein
MAKSEEIGNKCSKRIKEEKCLKLQVIVPRSLSSCHDARSKLMMSSLEQSWHDDSPTCHDGAFCQPVSAIDLLTSVHLMSNRATMTHQRGTMVQSVGHQNVSIKEKLGQRF